MRYQAGRHYVPRRLGGPGSPRDPWLTPIRGPIVPADPERDRKLAAATSKVIAAYQAYQAAIKELRDLGSIHPTPTVPSGQFRFEFADRFVVEHDHVGEPIPAEWGPNSTAHEPELPCVSEDAADYGTNRRSKL